MLVVDAANVVGSRPDGWWRDRAKAAHNLCLALAGAVDAGHLDAPVVVVLEGAARAGAAESDRNGLRIVHAERSGDDAIAALVTEASRRGQSVTLVTADRELRDRTRPVGCDSVGPRWLLDRL